VGGPPGSAEARGQDDWRLLVQLFRNMWTNAGTSRELLGYLWSRKLWWLVPMVVVLLGFGLLLVFASASGVGPFIYSLF